MPSLEIIALDTAVPQLRAPGAGDRYSIPRSIHGTANVLNVENGVTAQSLYVQRTFTDGANYERAVMEWETNTPGLTIGAQNAGTGLSRNLFLTASGSIFFNVGSTQRMIMGFNSLESTAGAGVINLGAGDNGWRRIYIDYTNTATVGAVTINKAAGRVNIAAAGTSIVVTNSLVTAASKVFAQVSQADATAYIRNVVPAAGSFTITLGAAATAQTSVDFFVVNTD